MRNQRGKGPENPGRLLKRLMGMLMKHYGVAIIIVAICIIINVLANVQGTMFMQRLIDDYITPLLKSETKNYTPLLHAIGRVACFYGIGIIASYSYNRIMVNVTQGMLKHSVIRCSRRWSSFQSNILTPMRTVISCPCIQMIPIR